ncbi:hypothetical protein D3P07_10310 [Paenibacillus sp. 1011MAR3C5]|uniref:hypothetical protein n=1 Tax=Paenibacillus sp. 1011MAR3C5 TaxID=1675787 RepID=UPI000E6BF8F1|nr:hypothetical protein [Paenibacillus sp. 1011MAR3C5]RJE88390.1 hypothetical protein D3P07_10310 [Paenibacillus sp. 1011MAR3C5]
MSQYGMIAMLAIGLLSALYYIWAVRPQVPKWFVWLPSLVIMACLAGTGIKFSFFQKGYSGITDIVTLMLLGILLAIHLLIGGIVHWGGRR